ncbi:MAG: hypothetical protein SGCHY_005378, partial [Lobulomycetales sp.]
HDIDSYSHGRKGQYVRLAYWIVGLLPDSWHLEVHQYSETALVVVFVESDTGQKTLVDPRNDPFAPLQDIGFWARRLWFHRFGCIGEGTLKITVNKDDYERDALKYLYSLSDVEWMGSSADSKVEYEGDSWFSRAISSQEFVRRAAHSLFDESKGLFRQGSNGRLEIAPSANLHRKWSKELRWTRSEAYFTAGILLGVVLARPKLSLNVTFTMETYEYLLGVRDIQHGPAPRDLFMLRRGLLDAIPEYRLTILKVADLDRLLSHSSILPANLFCSTRVFRWIEEVSDLPASYERILSRW